MIFWSALRIDPTKVDVIAIDSAHGHSQRVMDAIKAVKSKFPEVQLLAGNVASYEGARDLIRLGADGDESRHRAWLHLHDARGERGGRAANNGHCRMFAKPRAKLVFRLISDGGIKYSGDITKAIAAGADSVMIGSLLAGTDESPGETILYQGRTFKSYRGMGSMGAMPQGSSERYAQAVNGKLVPEGIEGRVPYKGPLADLVYQLVGGLRVRHGLLRLRHHQGTAGSGQISTRDRCGPARKPRSRRHYHQGSAKLSFGIENS